MSSLLESLISYISTSSNSMPIDTSHVEDFPSINNPEWTKTGVFPIGTLPPLILEDIFDLTGRASKSALLNLALTERAILYRSVYGIDAKRLASDAAEAQRLHPLRMKDLTSEEANQNLITYQETLKSLKQPALSFRLKISASFIAKIGIYLQDKLSIKAEDFHDIMGRDLIFAREANISDFQKTLDYARHIALTFGLAKFKPGDEQQNISALLTVDFSKNNPNEIDRHFNNQKRIVEKIKGCASSEEKELNLSVWSKSELRILTLPPHIGNLSKLNMLYLRGNKLVTLPPEVKKMENLTELYMGDNKFTSLPAEILQLKRLIRLGLSGNSKLVNTEELQELFRYLRTKQPACIIYTSLSV